MSIFSSQVVDWWLRKVYKFSVIKCLYSATGWWTGGPVVKKVYKFSVIKCLYSATRLGTGG
jgi:hypothetical protein